MKIKPIILCLALSSISACESSTGDNNTTIRCDDIVFQADIDTQHAVLFVFDETYQLTRTESASGEKYQNEHILLWLKGNDALVRFDSGDFKNCKAIDE